MTLGVRHSFNSAPGARLQPRPRQLASLWVAFAAGCAPGHVAWSTGDDLLRTAVFVEGGSRLPLTSAYFVLLSTGELGCDLPDFEDDPEQLALIDLYTAAVREDARHLSLSLLRHPEARPLGTYTSVDGLATDEGSLLEALGEEPRLAWGSWLGVEEAGLDLEGLCPEFEITETTFEPALGVDGQVTLRLADRDVLAGTFSFPDAHVSGRFRATRCDEGTSLFDLVFDADAQDIERVRDELEATCDDGPR